VDTYAKRRYLAAITRDLEPVPSRPLPYLWLVEAFVECELGLGLPPRMAFERLQLFYPHLEVRELVTKTMGQMVLTIQAVAEIERRGEKVASERGAGMTAHEVTIEVEAIDASDAVTAISGALSYAQARGALPRTYYIVGSGVDRPQFADEETVRAADAEHRQHNGGMSPESWPPHPDSELASYRDAAKAAPEPPYAEESGADPNAHMRTDSDAGFVRDADGNVIAQARGLTEQEGL
jgi:hypothetical protein